MNFLLYGLLFYKGRQVAHFSTIRYTSSDLLEDYIVCITCFTFISILVHQISLGCVDI